MHLDTGNSPHCSSHAIRDTPPRSLACMLEQIPCNLSLACLLLRVLNSRVHLGVRQRSMLCRAYRDILKLLTKSAMFFSTFYSSNQCEVHAKLCLRCLMPSQMQQETEPWSPHRGLRARRVRQGKTEECAFLGD